jgi:hypothetical protein
MATHPISKYNRQGDTAGAMTFRIMTLFITTLSKLAFSIMTLSIKGLYLTLSISDT